MIVCTIHDEDYWKFSRENRYFLPANRATARSVLGSHEWTHKKAKEVWEDEDGDDEK